MTLILQEISRYAPCTQSFVILISDGESTHDLNIPSILPGGVSGNLRDYDGDGNDPGLYAEGGSDYLDDVALWAHTNNLRVGDQELEESKNITLFTISAFGSGSQLLKDAAKNGGFIDLNDNGVPDLTSEWDSNDDGVPDNYFEAKDGFLLEDKLMRTRISMTLRFYRPFSNHTVTRGALKPIGWASSILFGLIPSGTSGKIPMVIWHSSTKKTKL
ncbi:MAG: hypothetical protein JRJ00_18645 [Deltaproteobacteria bacterium]|nr:hypothetical protein [Deltaproteobacteria bacterium]